MVQQIEGGDCDVVLLLESGHLIHGATDRVWSLGCGTVVSDR